MTHVPGSPFTMNWDRKCQHWWKLCHSLALTGSHCW